MIKILKKNNRVNFLALCMMFLTSSHAAGVAVGNYNREILSPKHPFILNKTEHLTWRFNEDIRGIPAFKKNFAYLINDVTCDSTTCIAASSANLRQPYSKPFFLVATNPNSTWDAKTVLNAPLAFRSYLNSVTCSDVMCIGVGDTLQEDKTSAPLMVISFDRGNSWTVAKNIPSWLSLQSGSLKQVTCHQNTCIAIGFYSEKVFYKKEPLLVVSQDAGQNWFVPDDVNDSAGFPKDAKLNTVKCQGKVCVIGGSQDYYANPLPLFLSSSNDGKSWHSAVLKQSSHGYITKVDFTEKGTVIAIGKAGLFKSEDGGHTWTQQWVQGYPKKLYEEDNNPLSLSCSAHNCIAGAEGYTDDHNTSHFPIIVTHNDGQIWSITDVAPLMQDGKGGHIKNINCVENKCTVIGTESDLSKPFILESEDGGVSWKAALIKGIPVGVREFQLSGLS